MFNPVPMTAQATEEVAIEMVAHEVLIVVSPILAMVEHHNRLVLCIAVLAGVFAVTNLVKLFIRRVHPLVWWHQIRSAMEWPDLSEADKLIEERK